MTNNEVPTLRGHKLSIEDQKRREQILQFMTKGEVKLDDESHERNVQLFLAEMITDGLVKVENGSMTLTDKGKPFLRNACLVLDERLKSKKPDSQVFSKSL